MSCSYVPLVNTGQGDFLITYPKPGTPRIKIGSNTVFSEIDWSGELLSGVQWCAVRGRTDTSIYEHNVAPMAAKIVLK